MAERMAFEDVTQYRLNRLERELRLWRLGGLVTLSLVAVAVAGAMADPPAKELSVRTLRIVDKGGKDRIVLTAEPGIPDMTFLDPAGKSRLTLDIAEDHKPVLLFSESGQAKSRLILGLEEGAPMLQLYDGAGKKRVQLGVSKEGKASIRILDTNERLRTRFP